MTPTTSKSEAVLNRFVHSFTEYYEAFLVTGADPVDPTVLEDLYYCASALIDECLLQCGLRPAEDDRSRVEGLLKLGARSNDFDRVAVAFQLFCLKRDRLLGLGQGVATQIPGPSIFNLLFRLREAAGNIIPGATIDQFQHRIR